MGTQIKDITVSVFIPWITPLIRFQFYYSSTVFTSQPISLFFSSIFPFFSFFADSNHFRWSVCNAGEKVFQLFVSSKRSEEESYSQEKRCIEYGLTFCLPIRTIWIPSHCQFSFWAQFLVNVAIFFITVFTDSKFLRWTVLPNIFLLTSAVSSFLLSARKRWSDFLLLPFISNILMLTSRSWIHKITINLIVAGCDFYLG